MLRFGGGWLNLGYIRKSALQAPPCGKCHRKRTVTNSSVNHAWVCAVCEMHVLAPAYP